MKYFIDWEVDDFSSHAKNITRRGFDYEKERQNQLVHYGWHVYRIPLDMIKERPRQCLQFILQVMGKLYGGGNQGVSALSLKHREIMRMAIRLQRPFTPKEVCILLGVQAQHARHLLHELVSMELLVAENDRIRARKYLLGPKAPTWI
ncbi:hypothetical protein FPL14_05495 [Cohnella cholangitidis]|uniref:Uncharacterized protein n=2 Tax=Cohnella cholangitidis TaxID=2598458 RepID=A0A7G5BUT5_9BACL|nr:hypothetical protein FPL14_05495 [Cohnella cholangitidis]